MIRVIMPNKEMGKVGIDMKREIRSTQSVSRPAMPSVVSVNNAARFFLAQLFFGIWFMPMPI